MSEIYTLVGVSRDTSISKVIGYGLDDRGSILDRDKNFFPHHHIQTDTGAHIIFSTGTGSSFLMG